MEPPNASAEELERVAGRSATKNKLDKPNTVATVQPMFMKNSPFAAILVALLFVSAALASVFALRYAFGTRDLRQMQSRVVAINNSMAFAQSLLNDTLEYSRRNPAIDPLLQSLNMKTNSAAGRTTNSVSPAQ